MNNRNTRYYLLWKRVVGRSDAEGFYLFENGQWHPDEYHVIMDHLYGYDPFEPENSPYRMFNDSVMEEIEEITPEQADRLLGDQLYEYLTGEWRVKFKKAKEEWFRRFIGPDIPASTSYDFNGKRYRIEPKDIGLTNHLYDQAFMLSIQNEIEEDLEKYGATEISSRGLMD